MSAPNVLFVGVGQGSWQVRGLQVAKALGARATTRPTDGDWSWAHVVVLVKRAIDEWGGQALRSRARVVWDVLDFWQQPEENGASEAELLRQIREREQGYCVDEVIGATRQMAAAIGGVYVPHHSRPGLAPAPPRGHLDIVAYEGTSKYLGPWRGQLETACARLGLTFVVNPPDLRHADLIVSFRGGVWDGEICRRWKSGVKYVNALAAGRPTISLPHVAFGEIGGPGTQVFEPSALEDAIKAWMPLTARVEAHRRACELATAYSLPAVAEQYRSVIAETLGRAA